MIHYHGMAGTQLDNTARLAEGRHIFVSHAACTALPLISSVCSTFALDNGAYSLWSKGKQVDYEKYMDFVDQWHRHPSFDWACIPDVIDGSEDENDMWLDRWPDRLPGVPVWHLHESLERLDRLVNNYRVVALGSSGEYERPGSTGWWRRMGEAMEVACDEEGKPKTKLHGLRMLDTRIFTRLPLSSADSTNAERNGLFERSYLPHTSGQRAVVIAWRVESNQSAEVWEPSPQMELDLAI